MSFILDALRKSDAERQRAATPGLADIRYSRRPARRSLWLPVLAVALLANLGILAVQWLRKPGAPPAAPAAVAVPAEAPGAAVPAAAPVPPPVRALAQEAEAAVEPWSDESFAPDDELPGSARRAPVAPVVAELVEPADLPAPPLPAAAPATAPALPPPPGTSRIREAPDLPTSDQLIAAGTLRVPALNLDLHVYNDAPARRFVIINGARYREGAALREGPMVETITSDGVILDSQGTRFILRPK